MLAICCCVVKQGRCTKRNESTEMQTLGAIRIATYNYSINVLSKCSNIISHRSSIFEDRHIDLRRSTHRSPKADTSIFKSRHIDLAKVSTLIIDLRRSTIDHRSSKVDRSSKIEDTNMAPTTQRRTDNSSPNIVHNGASRYYTIDI